MPIAGSAYLFDSWLLGQFLRSSYYDDIYLKLETLPRIGKYSQHLFIWSDLSRIFHLPSWIQFKTLNAQSHLNVSTAAIKTTKHGSHVLILPGKFIWLDLTIYMDVQRNPGPEMHENPSQVLKTPVMIKYSRSEHMNQTSRDVISTLALAEFFRSYIEIGTFRGFYDQMDLSTSETKQIPMLDFSRRHTRRKRDKRLAEHRNVSNLVPIRRAPMTQTFKPSKAMNFSLLNVRSLSNKASQVNEYIVDNKIDVMALTETWLLPSDLHGPVINEAIPRGYDFRHVSRGGRGGGVGVIFKKSLKPKLASRKVFKSFEYIDISFKIATKVLRVVAIYRPPPSTRNKLTCNDFFSDFTSFLELLAPTQGHAELLIAGDFNFHIDNKSDPHAKKFLQVLNFI